MGHLGEHREYRAGPLLAEHLDPDPVVQFRAWFADAEAAGLPEPEAMLLATAGADGQPQCRYVLLRGVDARGFQFFTSYGSAKAGEIAANPRVALTFGWMPLHRQVRITGTAERLPDQESDDYFATRPRGSQIGAWASPQSTVIAEREVLDRLVDDAEARFATAEAVPRPPDWGGYLVRPHALEFWQGRPNRLHDRLRYRPDTAGGWIVERLAP